MQQDKIIFYPQNHPRGLRLIYKVGIFMSILMMLFNIIPLIMTWMIGALSMSIFLIVLASVVSIDLVIVLFFFMRYCSAIKNLTFTLTPDGIDIPCLKKTHIPWNEIIEIKRFSFRQLSLRRISGISILSYFFHGLVATKEGQAWVWYMGAPEVIFIRAMKGNYLFAPDRIDEFESLVNQFYRSTKEGALFSAALEDVAVMNTVAGLSD